VSTIASSSRSAAFRPRRSSLESSGPCKGKAKGILIEGVGAAWQFTKLIAAFAEYRYTHFSPEFTFRDDVLGSATLSTDVNTHYLLMGVSFRF